MGAEGEGVAASNVARVAGEGDGVTHTSGGHPRHLAVLGGLHGLAEHLCRGQEDRVRTRREGEEKERRGEAWVIEE